MRELTAFLLEVGNLRYDNLFGRGPEKINPIFATPPISIAPIVFSENDFQDHDQDYLVTLTYLCYFIGSIFLVFFRTVILILPLILITSLIPILILILTIARCKM